MQTKTYLFLSAGIFAAVALGHLVRLAGRWPVALGPWTIPLWASIFGVLVPGILACWGFSAARRA